MPFGCGHRYIAAPSRLSRLWAPMGIESLSD